MPVIDEYRLLLASGVFVDWLQEQRQAHVVEYLSQGNIVWALDRGPWNTWTRAAQVDL